MKTRGRIEIVHLYLRNKLATIALLELGIKQIVISSAGVTGLNINKNYVSQIK